ncbi:MAG: YceI family protein [Proteiniphilum sp.]
MKRFLSILTICFLTSVGIYAQVDSYPLAVDVKEKSMLTIQGKSNVVDFKFDQPGEKFIPKKMYITASRRNGRLYLSETNLEIPVKNFISGNKMALKDFQKLVKSDKYPVMHIALDYVRLSDAPFGNVGDAVVDVTITGVTKRYTFPVIAAKKGNNFTFDVKKSISIRDFNLTPPVQMMGMLKVDEWITINLFMECGILPVDQAQVTQ